MASIIKRGTRFLVRVRVHGYPPLSKTFNDRRAAASWAAQAEDDVRRGVYEFSRVDVPTLAKALHKYGKAITPSKRGADKETYVLAALARLAIAQRPLDQIQAAEIARLRDEWLKALAPATVQRRMALLSHLFNTAIKEWGYSITNPLLHVTKPRVANQRTRTLSADELNCILASAPNETIKNISRLAWHTAARLGELVSLQWQDVDMNASTMTFPLTKNGSARTVPLVPAARALLASLQPKTPPQSTGPVFATSSGSMTKAWTAAVKKARKAYEANCAKQGALPDAAWLADAHFHDLRHSAVTRLAEHGLSTLELAAISGHKSLSMLGRYTHIKAETLATKLARLEAIAA